MMSAPSSCYVIDRILEHYQCGGREIIERRGVVEEYLQRFFSHYLQMKIQLLPSQSICVTCAHSNQAKGKKGSTNQCEMKHPWKEIRSRYQMFTAKTTKNGKHQLIRFPEIPIFLQCDYNAQK